MNVATAIIQERPRSTEPPFDYLRVSVTERCQLHCPYCRPRGYEFAGAETDSQGNHAPGTLGHRELFECCAAICAVAPVRKIRLSGGEPLLHPHLPDLVAALAGLPGRPEVVATTNGLLLAQRAAQLRAAGLSRLNVSLDTADRKTYQRLTGVDGLPRVLEGLGVARHVGFRQTKLNAVLGSWSDPGQLRGLAEVAADYGAELRLIELMPIGPGHRLWERGFVPAAEARIRLRAAGLQGVPDPDHHQFTVTLPDGRQVRMGIIAPMTRPFCSTCRRIRLSSDGKLIPCLLSPLRLRLLTDAGHVPPETEVRRLLLRCATLKRRATTVVDERMWKIGG